MPTKRTMGSDVLLMPARAAGARGSCQLLFPHHRPRIVERTAEARHHLIDLGLADDQRGAEGDDIAGHVAQYRPVVLCAAHEMRGDTGFGIEALPGRLVADPLDG